jgi:hypothetical protein
VGRPEFSPEQLEAVKRELPEDLFEALVNHELAIRRELKIAARQEARDRARRMAPGRRNRYRAIVSGQARYRERPVATAEDRQYVPGALRHWRQVHGINTREAQTRIGYSPRSSSWRHWEDGFVAPPYQTLLRIIAATGLSLRAAHDDLADVAPDLRLEATRTRHMETMRRRRARRKDADA